MSRKIPGSNHDTKEEKAGKKPRTFDQFKCANAGLSVVEQAKHCGWPSGQRNEK